MWTCSKILFINAIFIVRPSVSILTIDISLNLLHFERKKTVNTEDYTTKLAVDKICYYQVYFFSLNYNMMYGNDILSKFDLQTNHLRHACVMALYKLKIWEKIAPRHLFEQFLSHSLQTCWHCVVKSNSWPALFLDKLPKSTPGFWPLISWKYVKQPMFRLLLKQVLSILFKPADSVYTM